MSEDRWADDAAKEWFGPPSEDAPANAPRARSTPPPAEVETSELISTVPTRRRGARGRLDNWPLWLGAIALLSMCVLAIGAPWLAPHDPMDEHAFVVDEEGGYHWKPFAPGEVDGFPLGTDFDGRDVLSRLIWGLRPTLVLALVTALARILIATLLGIVAGWNQAWLGRGVAGLMQTAGAVPLLVIAIVLLYLLGGDMSTGDLVLALAATGWAGTSYLVASRVRAQRSAGYIEAARALGSSPLGILRRHVLPHLAGLLPMLAAFEMAAVLLVLGELGFLGFFLGGGETRGMARGDDPGSWLVTIPGQPELGQMLSMGWENFFQSKWLSLWAGLAFVLAVASFMLLGEGLRRAARARER